MIKFRIIFVFLLSAILFQNCKKEDADPLITSVDPSQVVLNGYGGEVKNFYFNASSKDGLNRLIISQQEVGSASKVILDSMMNGIRNSTYKLEYVIP